MTWLLIDGNNWFAQCDFASQSTSARNFEYRLQTLRDQLEHSLAVVCWDAGTSFRHELSTKYKAHRGSKPDDFHARLAGVRESLASIPDLLSVSAARFEADDLLATFAAAAHHEGHRCIVFSADRDLHQLLRSGSCSQVTRIRRATPTRLSFTCMTADLLRKSYGVTPDQWIDYRAIVGDTSDGIDGCRGLGPDAAAAVLRHCRTLDGFYRSPFAAPITARQRTALMNYRNMLPLKRQLLQLVDNVPLPASILQRLSRLEMPHTQSTEADV